MQVVLQVGELELDIEVSASVGADVGALAEALADGPVAPGTGMVVNGRFVPAGTDLAAAGIRQGDLLRLAQAPPVPPAPAAPVLELRVVGGVAAGTRVPLGVGSYVVGREGDVVVEQATVSARHARLQVRPDGSCTIEDLGSCNGTRLDGRFVTEAQPVGPFQLVELGAVQARVVPPAPVGDVAALGPPAPGSGISAFNRPPRLGSPVAPDPLVLPTRPPDPATGARFSWALVVAPLVLGAVMAVVFDPIMAAFAFFSPVMVVGTWWEDRRRVARQREADRRTLAGDLVAFRAALVDARDGECRRRASLHPDPAETLRRGATPSNRAWERRRSAPDALRLSLGLADVAWRAPTAATTGQRLPEVEAALAEMATLPRTPVEVDLGPGRVLGLVGPREPVAALLRSLVCQAAVHHGPADVQVAVLVDDARLPEWEWTKWLPHTRGRRAVGRETAEALVPGWGSAAAGGPALLVVVDGDGFTAGRRAPVRDLLASGSVGGVVVASSVDRLPAVCTTVVELDGPDGRARATEPATVSVVGGLLVAGVSEPHARRCARALAALEDPEADGGEARLPAVVGLLDLLGLGEPAASVLAHRWRSGTATSLAAVVGVGDNGPLVLDLVADGPHALVAGTTGSGKSELLRTLVASLAAGYGPDQLTFVLVDYKGGSAFAECARLPHVVGMVTDLDAHLGQRALRSLEAELRHRETVLARAGAADLAEYSARSAAAPLPAGAEPLPRLVVLIDEFATLAAELPDFVDALVGIAQRGRSLGMHLVLATQRPSGAVSDSIRANTNLRVALRVQDVPDSTDVIGTPQAAVLDRRLAGRGYVRLGHGEVVAFQAAQVTTVSDPGAAGRIRTGPFTFADPDPATNGPVAADDGAHDGRVDIDRLVAAAAAAWQGQPGRTAPRRPWLEPLPSTLSLDELPAGALGLADEPDRQRQMPFRWSPACGNLLLYGVAGSGTTTTLATLAVSLVRAGDPVQLYVLDFGSGALAPLAGLPHTGAVVAAGERERQERLVRTLRAELERRRRAVSGGGGGHEPPVVLLVDNLGGLCSAFDDVAGLPLRDDVLRLLADGPGVGMVTVATADRPGAVPMAMSSVVAERLLFRLADPYDYAMFGVPSSSAPTRAPGRAVDAVSHREVQVAQPGPGGLPGLADVVAGLAAAGPPPPGPPPQAISVLPERVAAPDIAGAADLAGPEWFVPIGVGDADLSPVGLHLGDGDHALVAGPARSGKSTVLCTVAVLVAAARPDVAVVGVALRRSPLRDSALAALVTDPAELAAALAAVVAAPGPQLVLVDDADAVDDSAGALTSLLSARRPDVHVVAAGRSDALRGAYAHWTAYVRRSRQGVALRPHLDLDGDLWHTVLPRRGPARFGPGRGYLVHEGAVELVQAAGPAGPVTPGSASSAAANVGGRP